MNNKFNTYASPTVRHRVQKTRIVSEHYCNTLYVDTYGKLMYVVVFVVFFKYLRR